MVYSGFMLVCICLLHTGVSLDYDESYQGDEAKCSKINICPKLCLSDNPLQNIDAIYHFPEMRDGKCAFPFNYKNQTFYSCIRVSAKHNWCSLNKTYQGYWKYCGKEDTADCVFPFWYKRLIYWECTNDGHLFGEKWCSLTHNYNKDHRWRYCD